MEIGTLLIESRHRLKLSQQEAAEKIGVSQGTYHNWESGKTKVSLSKLHQISSVLHIELSKLIPPTITVEISDNNKDTELKMNGLELYTKLLSSFEETIKSQALTIQHLQNENERLKIS
jgi:transcriptional regulator with XRE-family HTH domain